MGHISKRLDVLQDHISAACMDYIKINQNMDKKLQSNNNDLTAINELINDRYWFIILLTINLESTFKLCWKLIRRTQDFFDVEKFNFIWKVNLQNVLVFNFVENVVIHNVTVFCIRKPFHINIVIFFSLLVSPLKIFALN